MEIDDESVTSSIDPVKLNELLFNLLKVIFLSYLLALLHVSQMHIPKESKSMHPNNYLFKFNTTHAFILEVGQFR